jgi:hypothetical protein
LAKKARVYDGTAWQELASAQTDLTAYSTTAQTTAGFRNAIINGKFDIWQRGTSFNNPSSNAYLADRFVTAFDGTGATRTISQQAFTAGAAPVAGYESQYFLRYNVSVAGTGNTFNVLSQRMEDVRTFANQTITISAWIKADSARSVTVQLLQNFGSGGSSEVRTSIGTASVTTSWTRFTFSTTVASITGKTIGTSSFLGLEFWNPSNTTFTVDFWGVQVEAGSVATPFEQRPIGTELALCQRYYYRISSFGSSRYGSGYAKTSTTADIIVDFPVTMRVAPTALEQSGTAGDYLIAYQNSAVAGSSVPTFVGATLKAGVVNFNVGAVLTAGNGVMGGPNGANNYLGWSAEL